jgi:hypothetical protein
VFVGPTHSQAGREPPPLPIQISTFGGTSPGQKNVTREKQAKTSGKQPVCDFGDCGSYPLARQTSSQGQAGNSRANNQNSRFIAHGEKLASVSI